MLDRMRRLLGSQAGRQLWRYAAVGLTTNAAGYTVHLLLTNVLGLEPKRVMSCMYAVAATVGFFSHRRITFAYQGGHLGAGLRYALAHLLGYGINLCMLLVLVDGIGMAHEYVQAAAVLVVAAFLFVSFKFFVFPAPPPHGRSRARPAGKNSIVSASQIAPAGSSPSAARPAAETP